jgi:hypothetical protein
MTAKRGLVISCRQKGARLRHHVVKLPALSSLDGAGCSFQAEDTPGTLRSCLRIVLTVCAPQLWKIESMEESSGWAHAQGFGIGDILLTYEDAQCSLETLQDWRQRLYVLRKSLFSLVSPRQEGEARCPTGLTDVPALGEQRRMLRTSLSPARA